MNIRNQIRPFTRVATYPTGWSGRRTFEEIYEDLIPNLNRLLCWYGNNGQDVPDLIAHCFMRLWEDMSADNTLLESVDKGGALKLLLRRANTQLYKRFNRDLLLVDLATRSGDPDAFFIEGYDRGHVIGHSAFSKAIDLRLDIEQVMTEMAEKYMDSMPHLVALYYITTTGVSPDDAAALAGRSGTKKCWWLTNVVKPMREELCNKLGLFRPRRTTWKDHYLAGNDKPLLDLIRCYEAEGNHQMAETVVSMAGFESCKTLAARLDVPLYIVHMLRRNAHKAMDAAYRRWA